MALYSLLLCTCLTFSSSFPEFSSAVNYEVFNDAPESPGGIKFTEKIGIPYTKEIMTTSSNFIWSSIFKQDNPDERKPISSVEVYITDVKFDGVSVTWEKNKINFSASFLSKYIGDVKKEFTCGIYHEMTHVLQWDGEGKTPESLAEGIADYTLIKAKYSSPAFAERGDGNQWDEGFDVTARFLEYCDEVTPGFVAKLNKMMRSSYEESYFNDMTGKPVDQLWKEYKDKYGDDDEI